MALTHVKKGFGSAEWRPVPQPFTPDAFAARLAEVFGDRIRIRWSVVDGAWHVEEKVGRACLPPLADNSLRDDYVRARDGYGLIMVVQPGTTMPCPVCHLPLAVPRFETAEISCENCKAKGSDARHWAAYFPLDECLIDHLKSIDPLLRDQKHRVKAEEEADKRKKRLQEEADDRENAALLKDALLDQLPKAGFPSLVPDSWRH